MPKKEKIWHNLSAEKVLRELNSSHRGLTIIEVNQRKKKYGENVLAQAQKFSAWRLFFSQFKSALIYVLVIAGIISLIFSEIVDAYVIFAAVFLNLIIGFFQEKKANQALEKLQQVVRQETIVLRDGQELKLETKELVPGDIILIKAGDRIPADARLLSADFFEVNESNLTGESWPEKKSVANVDKGTPLADRTNMVFMGTLAVTGRAKAVVTETGLNTEIGQITTLLKTTVEEQTPLQKKLNKFAESLTGIIIGVALLIFFMGLLRGQPTLEMFTVSVALAVSAIPEGLLIGVTMILTIGMQRILKHQGLVRKLISAETLGSTTLICTDKTGTLTEGEMQVTTVITSQHNLDLVANSWKTIAGDKEIGKMLEISLLCNDSIVKDINKPRTEWEVIGSPTEKALLMFGSTSGQVKDIYQERPRLQEIPFDSQHKYMVTRHKYNDHNDLVYIKGAPEFILDYCSHYFHINKPVKLSAAKLDNFQKSWQELSRDGLRVLAAGYQLVPKNLESLAGYLNGQKKDFIFLGFWGLDDPLRQEAKETLQQALAAGIKTVIITGDNKFTARKVALSLGWEIDDQSILSGEELLQMTDSELARDISKIELYARVTPADKLRIIQAWQARGEVVAMTGDGVNDAPALKAADIGVVVNSGSDVAKEVADLVLLDNNFKTIVMAIRQGRVIFDNVRKVILYLLSDSFAEILIITFGIIFGLPLPLMTDQILWINLICDGFPALALTMEPEDPNVMASGYGNKKLFGTANKVLIAVISMAAGLGSLLVFYFFWKKTGDIALARTVVFTVLSLSTLFYVYSIRSVEHGIFTFNPFKNMYLNLAVLFGIVLQLASIYLPFLNKALHTVPLGWVEWEIIILFIILIILFIELMKYFLILYQKRRVFKQ